MSTYGDDEYGDIDDDIWEQALTQVTQASQKLPSHSPSRRKRRRISPSDDEIEDEEEVPSQSKRRKSRGSTETGDEEVGESEKKKNRYKIHYGAEEVPPAVIMGATQADGLPDSSPWRIRGPIYRKPRPAPEPSPVAAGQKQTKIASIFAKPAKVQTQMKPPPRPPPSVNDFAKELEDLPSDAFSPSPEAPRASNAPIEITSSPLEATQTQRPPQRLVAPQNGLRQTTLFGGRAPDQAPPASQAKKVHNYLVDKVPEEPTHHELDKEAMKTWVYPINLGSIREYQYSIVYSGLFNNTLVALPTGLGKTFIAATIMLNYFRWTRRSQIVFVAPTKPLVAQQVKACFEIVGIPRSATTMLTGEQSPALRAEEWAEKRVFFMTPQTLNNDLKTGIADPKRIVLLVVDEAHRATGNYAYAKVVQFMRRFNKSYRVLALTATPGSTVEAVQEVIDNLEISQVEIRTEESIDIKQYVHRRNIDQIVLNPSEEMIMVMDLLAKALQPLVDDLCSLKSYYSNDPMSLTTFGLIQARKAWFASPAGQSADWALKGKVNALFTVLTSVAHCIKLLNFHGIGPFFSSIKDFRSSVEDGGKGGGGMHKKRVLESPEFRKMMDRVQMWINNPDFIGHPKLTSLCETVLNHFLDAGSGRLGGDHPPSSTRVIVFAEYRDSAEGIARTLNKHGDMIRASVFVGQADSKRSEGMNQAKQLETIQKFKAGIINVIVATSIGEEGLDIGQVDLIVCYDSSSSPIRMLQRMGRTGRKRTGKVVLLLMRGKEEESYRKSTDNYEKMQKMISSGSMFNLRNDLSARILPREVKPVVDKRIIEIPPENTQDSSMPEPRRRAKPTKRAPKKFHMPDGVQTGFQKASRLTGGHASSTDFGIARKPSELNDDELAPIPLLESVVLSASEERELSRRFLDIPDGASQEVSPPSLTAQTTAQRSLLPTAKVRHGKCTERCVKLFGTLAKMQDPEDRWVKPYGDEPPSNIGTIPSMPSEADLSPPMLHSKSPKLPRAKIPKAKTPKTPARTTKKAAAPKSKQASRSRNLQNEDDDDSDDSMLGVSQTQLTANTEEEGPGDRVDRTSDVEESEDSDLGSLEDFIMDDDQDDDEEHGNATQTLDSSFTSSPPVARARKPQAAKHQVKEQAMEVERPKPKLFYEPTIFTQTQESNDADDLPDISTLVAASGKKATPVSGKEKEKRGKEKPESVRRKRGMFKGLGDGGRRKQRRIVESDSDE